MKARRWSHRQVRSGDWAFTLLSRTSVERKKNERIPRSRLNPLTLEIGRFLATRDDVRIGFGFAGGLTQPAAQAQFVSNVADFGMNIQEAVAAPRFGMIIANGCAVDIEARIDPAVRSLLSSWGHTLTIQKDYTGDRTGFGHAVMRRADGVNFGAADPRWDGEAIPEMPNALLEAVK